MPINQPRTALVKPTRRLFAARPTMGTCMPVVDFRGVDFEHSLSSSDLAAAEAKIASAISAEKALHQAMVAEFQSGTPGHPAVSCYLTSEPVKLACAVQAGK